MKKNKSTSDPDRLRRLMAFLDAAYADYLAARVLLLRDLLPQGAVLASTAIEKYLKAFLAFRGNEVHGHLQAAQFRALKNFDPTLSAQISPQYVDLLQLAYKLRYPDDLPRGFNLLIAQREFLAELDFTSLLLHRSFHIRMGQADVGTRLTTAERDGDERLHTGNHVLEGVEKQVFIAGGPQRVYAIRMQEGGPIEINCTMTPRPSDGQFMRPAIVPQPGKADTFFIGLPGVEIDP